MKHTEFTCSNCGSANLRRSHSTSLSDFPKMALGIYPFRCLDCRSRIWLNIWLFSKSRYAMCPRCLISDVIPAPKESMRLTLAKKLLLAIGARGFRCSVCKHSFITFKRAEPTKPAQLSSEDNRQAHAEPEIASVAAAGK